ncbi:hypothetical protein BCV70DRAFT_8708 [Testicularia cyperi]|uniref:Uncharacterized protein n=1 Tax=Testicularia cyperi TaxID=1882483 RepID=A0A317XXV4_9BASI|nr:hypothetical protein BCV70DRAFT_8708 [Testicularia cyperi]
MGRKMSSLPQMSSSCQIAMSTMRCSPSKKKTMPFILSVGERLRCPRSEIEIIHLERARSTLFLCILLHLRVGEVTGKRNCCAASVQNCRSSRGPANLDADQHILLPSARLSARRVGPLRR